MKKTRTMSQTALGVPMGANQRDDSSNDRDQDRERSSSNNNNSRDNNNRDRDWNPNTGDNSEKFAPRDNETRMGKVVTKWSQIVARKTADSQSKVCNTGTNKKGGDSINAMMESRRNKVRKMNATRARERMNNRRIVRRSSRVHPVHTQQELNQDDAHLHPAARRAKKHFLKCHAPTA